MRKLLSAIVAVTVVGLPAGGAIAQSTIRDLGAEKTVEAAGDDVRVAAAKVVVNGQATNVKAAGASVAVHADIAENADVAGAEVTIDGSVGRRLRAAGGTVTVTGDIGGEALLAGGVVTLTSAVGGRLRLAGGQVSVGQQSTIGGRAEIAGGSVTFDGRGEAGGRLVGGVITINGTFNGDVVLEGGRIVIGPTAAIAGNLVVRSLEEPSIDPAATIGGSVRREAPSTWWEQMAFDSWPFRLGFAAFLAASTLLTGIVTMLLGRGAFEDAVTLARGRVVSSFLIGLVGLVLLPVGAAILIVSLIGIPAGVALLLLLPVLLVVSYAVVATGLADSVFNRPQGPRSAGRTLGFLIVGAIVLGLLSLIPVAGPIVILLLVVLGAGAFLRSARRRARRSRRRPPVGEQSPVAA